MTLHRHDVDPHPVARAFLALVALTFIAYGVACALDPALPARLAGLAIKNADGYAELSAMYGGLQIGVGLFLALAAFQPLLQRPAFILLVVAIGLLAVFRGVGVLRSEDAATAYSFGALAFETLVTAIAAGLLLQRSR
jgi:hypothetical protein